MDLEIDFDYDDYFGVPTVRIDIDGALLYDGPVEKNISASIDLQRGDHVLTIQHYGKMIHHQDLDHDRHVQIRRILFDSTDLDQREECALTRNGEFFPEYEESYRQDNLRRGHTLPDSISPNHYLGHNGAWRLKFQTPALLWIIKQQNPHGIHLEDTVFSTSRTVTEDVKKFFNL